MIALHDQKGSFADENYVTLCIKAISQLSYISSSSEALF